MAGEVRSRLAEARTQRKLSQEALAQIAGVRIETIRSLEAGTARAVRFATLASICDVLHCQPGDLFTVPLDGSAFPVLGGPEEDEILRCRLSDSGPPLDGPALLASLLGPHGDTRTLG
ncbi:MAG: Helix-turn-helix protein [Chloroflexi bacterium]|nr:Helix-turn-helix protein [Chloroflexota bacterium]